MSNAPRDENRVPTLLGVSSADGTTPTKVEVNPSTGAVLTEITGGSSSGTEYTEGDTDASITGTAILWEDASNTLRPASAAKPFPVEIIAGAGSGGTAAADDADFTAGTTSGTPAMGVYEATPTSVTDGDLGTVGITEDRRLKTSSTIDAALPAGTNNIGDVDVLSSALPTGASTSAKQDTIIGHLDGVETTLGTIDTDTGNISTKIDTLAGAVSGTEFQVDVLTMPTTTVQATNLDIRDLTSTDVVTANLSATDNAVLDNIDADTSAIQTATEAIQTAVEILDNAISGNEMQVDVVGALPAGTNAIGKLTQPATGTLANITMTGSSVTLAASNTSRRGLSIYNDAGVVVYVKFGSTASSTSFTVKMADQSFYELPEPVYTGIVTALGASGDVRVTENT